MKILKSFRIFMKICAGVTTRTDVETRKSFVETGPVTDFLLSVVLDMSGLHSGDAQGIPSCQFQVS